MEDIRGDCKCGCPDCDAELSVCPNLETEDSLRYTIESLQQRIKELEVALADVGFLRGLTRTEQWAVDIRNKLLNKEK